MDPPAQTPFQRCLHAPHAEERNQIYNALAGSILKEQAKQASRMAACGHTFSVRLNTVTGKVTPFIPRCTNRLCPFCTKARTAAAAKQITAEIRAMAHPRKIVLTVPNSAETLGEQLRRLRRCFRKLRGTSSWKQKAPRGLYTFEVTWNPDAQTWHPHVHAIYDGVFYPFAVLKADWSKAVGTKCNVWIADVKDIDAEAVEQGKYLGKPPKVKTMPAARIREYAKATHGARLLQTFGFHIAKKVEDTDSNEPDSAERWPISVPHLVYMAERGNGNATAALTFIVKLWPITASFVTHIVPPKIPFGTGPPIEQIEDWNNRLSQYLFELRAEELNGMHGIREIL